MGAQDRMPAGTLRRSTGTHQTKKHLLRSRPGSTLLYSVSAHSLFRFADARFQGVGTELLRNGASVKTGLDGSRLRFVRMPPTVGVVDYLFVAGGGDLFKVDSAGAATNWGIDAPTANPTAADNGAGTMGVGTYQYRITFRNQTTGQRSNGNPTAASVTIIASRQVRVSSIPTSSDTQVSRREVWRTQAGGVQFFLLATISDNTTTTYDDNTADASLGSTALPTDNTPPDDRYRAVAGPYYGRAFWARININGQRGRCAYSASGRPGSDVGFLDVTNDDDPTQELVLWNGSLWAFTESRLFQILGTDEPFTYREAQGAPGTVDPESVCATPYGIVYKANDGLRLFNGAASRIIGEESVVLLFRGETLEGISSLGTAVAHAYGRDEYFVSDGTVTLAVNVSDGTWRNVGVACTALFYEDDTGKLIASIGAKVLLFEEVSVLTDDGTAISFEVETPALISDVKKPAMLQRVYVEANTRSQWLTPRVLIDGVVTVLPQFQSSARTTQEFSILSSGRVMSVRLTGNVSDQVEVFGVEADVDLGAEPITPSPVVGSKEGVVSVAQAQAAT